ncbi:hypothetical protein BDD43_0917 [Mucilaginibacter gracilis]|uniref:OmpL-like beta-barrel porin-2 n=1 Tax=Mucilaginibacter gracilis TaxID=423350 RepID=A0A495IWA2_9SPHI|nr:hypothetical protein [Mucilaginibacter gracilis]RKR80783.1 hypothetical protein BDD43_0917 [Mucilaginibacter gracilis]
MKSPLYITIILLILSSKIFAQGCVAIRSTGGVCTMLDHPDSTDAHGGWVFNSNNRYFKSYKHFIGRDEQTQRIALGTNVINHAYTQDLALTRVFNSRWSVAIDVPVISNSRSSLYEHGGKERHSTYSFGLGDIRFATYAWLLNPAKTKRFNVQVGLGLKLATGVDNYQDYFYNTGPNGTKLLGPVDQSIQLGDGGTGITLEVNTFYHLTPHTNLYGNFYYLANPRNVNGVSTARGGTPSATAVANGSDVMSVPDQFMIRGGASIMLKQWTFSAGLRDECLPVYDLIGGSDGFRRPGYIISAEPGITYAFHKITIYAFMPWALIRNRTQSVADKITTDLTGVYAHGDAAFADYVINTGISVKF